MQLKPGQPDYWIYILRCEKEKLYTGFTTDLLRRYREHQNKSSRSKFTRAFSVIELAQCWPIFGTRGDAMRVEAYIKKLSRGEKMTLINHPNLLKVVIVFPNKVRNLHG